MLQRQKVILALLAKVRNPIPRTHLVKLLFLLREETELGQISSFYDFLPYKYGPFSFALYREMHTLERDGYVSESDLGFQLNERTRELSAEKAAELPRNSSLAVEMIVSRHAAKNQRSLIKDVYNRYPWYATKSELSDLLPSSLPATPAAAIGVYTVGYEGKSVDSFFGGLLRAGIASIIDVRANPLSRKYGFAKRSLSEIASKLGLGYHHLPELGIPSDHRRHLDDFESYQMLLDWYEREVLPRKSSAIRRLISLLREKASAILCMERDVRCCHRGRLAKIASIQSGLSVTHL
jgi:uncharacterized protein (DUF488 family)